MYRQSLQAMEKLRIKNHMSLIGWCIERSILKRLKKLSEEKDKLQSLESVLSLSLSFTLLSLFLFLSHSLSYSPSFSFSFSISLLARKFNVEHQEDNFVNVLLSCHLYGGARWVSFKSSQFN
jgi:hypothetical protein